MKLNKQVMKLNKQVKHRLKTIKCLKEVSTNEWMIDNFLTQMVLWLTEEQYEEFIGWVSDNDCGYDINEFVKNFKKIKKDEWQKLYNSDWYKNTI